MAVMLPGASISVTRAIAGQYLSLGSTRHSTLHSAAYLVHTLLGLVHLNNLCMHKRRLLYAFMRCPDILS